jgi:biopolymer transport protein ExbD
MRRLLTVLFLASLSACTQQHVSDAEAAQSAEIVIGFQPPDTCSMTVGEKTFVLNKDQNVPADATLKRELAIHPGARIVADLNTPYKCMGGAIVELQRAGFKKIGFISEPPPASGK